MKYSRLPVLVLLAAGGGCQAGLVGGEAGDEPEPAGDRAAGLHPGPPAGPPAPGARLDAGASPAPAAPADGSPGARGDTAGQPVDGAAPGRDASPPDAGPPPPAVLPVIMIDVAGKTIGADTKTRGRIRVIVEHKGTHDDLASASVALDTPMDVELRGSSSLGYAQKSFTVELLDGAGQERELPLLDMPRGSDWALVACWADKPCMRNMLAYSLARELGRWNPRARLVEVFLDGRYNGLYQLVEPIRVDRNRLDVAKPAADAASGDLTGAYVIRRESNGKGSTTGTQPRSWVSPVRSPDAVGSQIVYTFHYPRYDRITTAQRTYIGSTRRRGSTTCCSTSSATTSTPTGRASTSSSSPTRAARGGGSR